MNTRRICTFATAYCSMHLAIQAGEMDRFEIYQEMYVDAADDLGIPDEDHYGLKDHRAEVKRRRDDFVAKYRHNTDFNTDPDFAAYCERHPLKADQ